MFLGIHNSTSENGKPDELVIYETPPSLTFFYNFSNVTNH